MDSELRENVGNGSVLCNARREKGAIDGGGSKEVEERSSKNIWHRVVGWGFEKKRFEHTQKNTVAVSDKRTEAVEGFEPTRENHYTTGFPQP